jgi:hypothetical protein
MTWLLESGEDDCPFKAARCLSRIQADISSIWAGWHALVADIVLRDGPRRLSREPVDTVQEPALRRLH